MSQALRNVNVLLVEREKERWLSAYENHTDQSTVMHGRNVIGIWDILGELREPNVTDGVSHLVACEEAISHNGHRPELTLLSRISISSSFR